MARRSRARDAQEIRRELLHVLQDFEALLAQGDLRAQVLALIPAHRLLKDLGSSLMGLDLAGAATGRILRYFQRYVGEVIDGEEILVIAGIHEFARRIRELRVQEGWKIMSGVTLADLVADEDEAVKDYRVSRDPTLVRYRNLKPDQYVLVSGEQDRDAAHRWHFAHKVRNEPGGVKMKLLKFLRGNLGKNVTGEELKYVAGNRKEWTRRIRELRTQEGWAVFTKMSGRPDLAVGDYIMVEEKQAEMHDRAIPDDVRVEVLERDRHACRYCGWTERDLKSGDPRKFLELHHLLPHVSRGGNTPENLITLCNVHHDTVHRDHMDQASVLRWLKAGPRS